MHLPAHVLQPGKGLPEDLPHGGIRVIDGELLQQAQSRPLGDGDRAALILLLPRQDLEQGGLAAAVGPHQSHPFPGGQVKGQVPEDLPLAEILIQPLYADLCHNFDSPAGLPAMLS